MKCLCVALVVAAKFACATDADPIASYLCRGEKFIPDEGQSIMVGGDAFAFRAKSEVYQREAGGYRIDYQLPLIVEDGTAGYYNGVAYLLEWNSVLGDKLKDTAGALLVAPFFRIDSDLDKTTRGRFLRIGFNCAFLASVFTDAYELSPAEDSDLKLYDMKLKVRAKFNCPAYRPKAPT
ncbi:MAG: hypothetical protein HYR96_09765 [Deltaproteobacteria bacterium]|nr:hypothetical protein [Deltaproteobacteria bacterium]